MPSSEPTDRQLRALLYHVARAYLEVERGLRPPGQLERYLTPAEYRRQRKQPLPTRLRSGEPVIPTDIGRIHLDRHLPGQVTASVPTREDGDHWGAVVLHLARNHTGRWKIDQLERLTRPNVARDRRRRPDAIDLDERIRRRTAERRLVEAAYLTTERRLTDLRHAPDAKTTELKTTMRMLREQNRAWKRRGAELDAELGDLRNTGELRQQLADVDVPASALPDPTRLNDRQLIYMLGPVPDHEWRRQLWNAVAGEVHTYRARWNITDRHTVLGDAGEDPAHERERDELAQTLRASARALRDEQHRHRGLGTAAEREPATRVDHGLALEG